MLRSTFVLPAPLFTLAACAAPPTCGERPGSEGGEISRPGAHLRHGADLVERGERLVAEGERPIERGRDRVSRGRERLNRGERLMRESERRYRTGTAETAADG